MAAETLSNLLARQKTECQFIMNFLINTDKIGADGQTYTVLSNRLELLETYWRNVSTRHFAIILHEDILEDEDYIKEDRFAPYEGQYVVNMRQYDAISSKVAAAKVQRRSS